MNYLGHAYFSLDNEKAFVGNLVGDFIKGNIQVAIFDNEFKEGVRWHRHLDSWCDRNEVFREIRKIFSPYRHYSGVLVDIVLDHFLALHFTTYHEVTLEDFSQRCYHRLEKYRMMWPENFERFFQMMKTENFLVKNRELLHIETLLEKMSKRYRKAENLALAINELKSNYDYLERLFHQFMKQAIKELKDEHNTTCGN